MIEIAAIFVACQINLLVCFDLPFNEDRHTFLDPDKCRAYVARVVELESVLRRKNNDRFPVVIGKCKYYMNEKSDATIF